MGEYKEQKIAVILSFNKSDQVLINNGIRIASIFKKELCLLVHNRKNSVPENWMEKIETHISDTNSSHPDLKITHLVCTESNKNLPDRLADDDEVILIITSTSSLTKYSDALKESPIPFLFVDENNYEISLFKKIILATDLRSENKDSALWSSYFGRFNQSEIVIVAANDHSKDEQNEVARNILVARKLFKKFKILHQIFKGEKSSFGNAFEALEVAKQSGCDLLIILGSSVITPIDLLIGLPERKIIKRAGSLPILIVNPRRDNYILCD